jgi:hypothetical protein
MSKDYQPRQLSTRDFLKIVPLAIMVFAGCGEKSATPVVATPTPKPDLVCPKAEQVGMSSDSVVYPIPGEEKCGVFPPAKVGSGPGGAAPIVVDKVKER